MTSAVSEDDVDVVIEADNLPEVVDKISRALAASEAGDVYQLGDVLVVGFVGDDDLREQEKKFRLVALDEEALAQRVNRIGFRIARRDRRDGSLRKINCPAAVARVILKERRYSLPQLNAVVETPIIVPDGTCLDRRGYSGRYGLLVHVDQAEFPSRDFRGTLTPDDVDAAVACLRSLLRGFPFDGPASESVAIAALMTAVLRPGLLLAPGFVISATAPGTGKTLLTTMLGVLATGRDPGMLAWPDDEIELRKSLLAALCGGGPILAIDNVNGTVRSDALCMLLTATRFRQRRLGLNEEVEVPTRVLITLNGNNCCLSGDLVRRFLICHLDAGVEHPEHRRFEFDPLKRLRTDRAEYVRAVLNLTRAYLSDRRTVKLPQPLSPFAGFDEWSRLVREPMVYAGLPDPLATQERAADLDPDRQQLAAMLVACESVVGSRSFDAAALVQTSKAHIVADEEGNARRHALREALAEVAMRGGEISTRALGHWFRRVEGRLVANRRFLRQLRPDGVHNDWKVERLG